MLDPGSLTARLIRASKGDFRVTVLSQSWQLPRPSERRLLGLKQREAALVREVQLECHGQAWVYARSVMPVRSLNSRLRHLRKFDDSALGAMLFKDPSMRRAPYEIARFSGNSELLPKALRGEEKLWGRRSCFYLSGLPLMVSEIFLPAFQP